MLCNVRGPAENMTILATGKDMSGKAPTDRHEPMLMVINYEKGVFSILHLGMMIIPAKVWDLSFHFYVVPNGRQPVKSP